MSKGLYSEFNNARVLVVGGAGFVGSNLVRMLLNSASQVSLTVIDNLISAERANVPYDTRISFVEGSISDDATLSRIVDEYDFIFHLATYHGNQNSIADPLADHDNNTFTTLKLYEHIRNFGKVKKIVYSSAGCSVAKKTSGRAIATTEEHSIEINQDSPYSISKIIGEFYSVYYYKQHYLPTIRARFQNVYGPGEILGAGKWRGTPATVWRNVIPVFVYKALKGKALPLENNGIDSRDFIFVEDICRGLISCALNGKPGEVYNLASGTETTISKLAKLINDLTNNKAGFAYLPKRSWDSSGRRFGSTIKAEKNLSFKANTNLRAGLTRTVAWMVDNMKLIDSTIARHENNMRTYYLLQSGKSKVHH